MAKSPTFSRSLYSMGRRLSLLWPMWSWVRASVLACCPGLYNPPKKRGKNCQLLPGVQQHQLHATLLTNAEAKMSCTCFHLQRLLHRDFWSRSCVKNAGCIVTFLNYVLWAELTVAKATKVKSKSKTQLRTNAVWPMNSTILVHIPWLVFFILKKLKKESRKKQRIEWNICWLSYPTSHGKLESLGLAGKEFTA